MSDTHPDGLRVERDRSADTAGRDDGAAGRRPDSVARRLITTFTQSIDDARRSSVLTKIAVVALVVFLLLIAFSGLDASNKGGDTANLVRGARLSLDCVHLGEWTECQKISPVFSDVGPYPLLQYVPAAALIKLGASDEGAAYGLATINLIAFALALLVAGLACRRAATTRFAGHLAVIVLAVSPLIFYTTAGFGEMLAAAALLFVVAAALDQRPILLFAALILAGISKETMPFIAVAFGYLAAVGPQRGGGPERRWIPRRSIVISLALGGLAGFAANSLFNVFRFGTPSNVFYLQSVFRTDSTSGTLENFLLMFGSPNSGVPATWPLLAIPAVLLVVAAVRAVRDKDWAATARWLLIIAGPVVIFAGMSSWFSPFGWIAWGPRLQLPVLPAWALLAIAAVPADLVVRCARAVSRTTVRLVASATVVALCAVMVAALPWSYGPAIERLIEADATCARMTEVVIENDRQVYFDCVTHYAMRRPGIVQRVAAIPTGPAAGDAQVALAIAAVLLLIRAAQLANSAPASARRSQGPRRTRSIRPSDELADDQDVVLTGRHRVVVDGAGLGQDG